MWGIKSINIVNGTGVATYEVGKDGVDDILDNRREYPDHTEFIFYIIDKNGNTLNEIINCPVDVKYGEID